jgi:hypothetical protein
MTQLLLKLRVMTQSTQAKGPPQLEAPPKESLGILLHIIGYILTKYDFRGEEGGFETTGVRMRKPKSIIFVAFNYDLDNFSEDFVYDDYVMRSSIN